MEILKFNETQLKIIDSLIGFYGSDRTKVIQTLTLLYIEQNMPKILQIKATEEAICKKQ